MNTKENIDLWLNGNFDDETKIAIRNLSEEDLTNSFYTHLHFGTAGMRGLMGPGTNRMNKYTVRGATLGLANYLLKTGKGPISVLIGYDSRHHSQEFAIEAARVLAAKKIKVYLFEELRPVPLVSFGTRFKHCKAGIMITASHNPAEYNGYKVYWSDGGQVLPPHDKGIIDAVNAIASLDSIPLANEDDPLIEWVGPEIDLAYLDTIERLQQNPERNQQHGDELSIIYTPLHGAGITMVPKALAMWGFINLHVVEEQAVPDGDFSTVPVPNPEVREAMRLGIEALIARSADLLLATDPDTDRVGVAIQHNEEIVLLDGNQIAALCLEHVLSGPLPEKPAAIKSIVTTELLQAIADFYSVPLFNVLTGFKYIGEKMTAWEKDKQHNFVFGAEESYGYLLGDYARDKDAVIACCLISEIALKAKLEGKTLLDKLHDLYKKYSVYRSKLASLNFGETQEGREQLTRSMERIRKQHPTHLLGNEIIEVQDFLKGAMDLPKTDLIIYRLADGSKIAIRPSGTEPKVKIYAEVKSTPTSPVPLGIEHCDTIASEYLDACRQIILP